MDKMKKVRPDVIVLDLEMPRMNGMTFLQKIMAQDPIPVVVCSGLAGPGTDGAVRALEHGAVAIINKPEIGVRGFLEDSAVMLIDTVLGAARARVVARPPKRLTADVMLPARSAMSLPVTARKVIAIGASTGGTEALRVILAEMTPEAPGIVIVQHMPEVFTKSFSKRLNETCRIEVKEAETGDRVLKGRALIAPGNRHMMIHRGRDEYFVEVVHGPLVSRHRPSADVLFRSVAQSAGPNAVGAILTGMGDDGVNGLMEMKLAGAVTIAQNEATCAVFGMPKEAIARGAVERVVALPDLARIMVESINTRSTRPLPSLPFA
jgi:two-component system chemotaxis response regulator CheB